VLAANLDPARSSSAEILRPCGRCRQIYELPPASLRSSAFTSLPLVFLGMASTTIPLRVAGEISAAVPQYRGSFYRLPHHDEGDDLLVMSPGRDADHRRLDDAIARG
jgi:hypothetical protein